MFALVLSCIAVAIAVTNLIMIHRGNLRLCDAEAKLRSTIAATVRENERRRLS
ncbi:hypothetical protein [Sphingomonas sanxanigenens]|uniref:Uncharacterized protein n=1 Tax=Sphingomonas sanxanigenens DSM 19645 = NX02 TaxID=1123269 RepID=W0A6C4_9SPHN|nr:hypothetical protein [Sphingomonas sanxanigenens]AHE52611.1 hypothetical protein NX02_04315 [Sphingomonas sanxanigenens DSM 19645 = NX02]